MKIWNGYGTEHSMNLVMVGHFKNESDANKTQDIIDKLSTELSGKIDVGSNSDYYNDEIHELLKSIGCYILSPSELEHFLYEFNARVVGKKIVLTTDETDVSAFFKLMMHNGAKVEVYSAHDYPEEEYGRGKK